jgi:hypothetical protein
MSTVIPKPCWDAGATLSGNKAGKRIKTLTPQTPNLWKAFPHHVTLRKQEGCHIARCWLQTCLGDIWQTNRRAPTITWYSPSHPWDKPTQLLGKTNHPLKKKRTIKKELKNNTQQRGRVVESASEKGGRARRWYTLELSINKGWKGRMANS